MRFSHKHSLVASAAALVLAAAAMPSHAAIVYANSPTGDVVTGPAMLVPIGTSNWYYNNVRTGAVEGIQTAYPRSGDGSVHMTSNGSAAKADVEYYQLSTLGPQSLGRFLDLSAMSYEWYRNSSSTTSASFQPTLRVFLDRDGSLATPGDQGYLVFEPAAFVAGYTAPTDTWVSESIGASTPLWPTRFLDVGTVGVTRTLASWQGDSRLADALILGFSSGIGSGWNGTFDGAVDNISWTIGGTTTMSNFEVRAAEVPEPSALLLLATGLALVGVARRRKQP